ncbi:hypothetical protein B0T20DRAFT_391012 [Sordaria brevicollis]|uniref:intramembrane prenyl-peptidase Rce1 n=1 Tax=Sordaria brevicollis TaxID=83679 RepID=A0AAE0PJR8_SORBR|nr:hypothetical protein B0T20DRAFT_391012 [Sordaria brevicollis]
MVDFSEVFHRLNPWSKDTHPISTTTASLLLLLYALSYFLPFYTSPLTRPSPTLSRDNPSVIRARIRSVCISCFFCCLSTFLILLFVANLSVSDALHYLGFWPLGLTESARALALTALLFAGPLFLYLVVDDGYKDWLRGDPLKEVWGDMLVWRNIVAGPLTEELLFRTSSVPLFLLSPLPVSQTIFLSPIIFGLAHVHHFYEFRLQNPRVPVFAALLRSIFQFSFTTLFGAYATFVFIRTGSLLAAFAVHAFCNGMGLPKVWGRVERYDGRGNDKVWTGVYYALLVAGAYGFGRELWVLTEGGNGLVPTSAFRR